MRSHDPCYRSPIRHPFIFPRPNHPWGTPPERQDDEATGLVLLRIGKNRNILTIYVRIFVVRYIK